MGPENVPAGTVWVAPAGTPIETFPNGWQKVGYRPNYTAISDEEKK